MAYDRTMASLGHAGTQRVFVGSVRRESGGALVFVPWAPVVWNPAADSVSAILAGPAVDDTV